MNSLPLISSINYRTVQKPVSKKMDDLDSLFEGELASIDQVFQEFEIKDKKQEKRNLTEQEDLQKHQKVRGEGVLENMHWTRL